MPKSKNFYALFVGINQYHPNSRPSITPLDGCVNDVQNFSIFLKKSFEDLYSLKFETLLNEEATYDTIIDHLGSAHLAKAGKEDLILFYYSGHGAREKAAKEFLPFFPEGKEETLVCYDSRTPNGKDLADKELAVLIAKLSEKSNHVVVVMDCCHSGSGTKEIDDFALGKARQTYDRAEERPLSTYLDGYYAQQLTQSGKINIPVSKHILLAACSNREKAFELNSKQGLFTSRLLKVLKRGTAISYANLFSQCRAAMRQLAKNQNPQFETYEQFNAHQPFLNPNSKKRKKKYLVFREEEKWWVECGAIHGLPADQGRAAQFEIFLDRKSLGFAKAKTVGIQKSELVFDFDYRQTHALEAVLISLPAPPILIDLFATNQQTERLKKAFSLGIDSKKELEKKYEPIHFQLISGLQAAKYQLRMAEQVEIIHLENKTILRTIKGDDHTSVFQDAFQFLEHLAQWEKALKISHPTTAFDIDKVSILLEDLAGNQLNKEGLDAIILDAPKLEDGFEPIDFRLRIANNCQQELYFSLVYFSPDYGIHPIESKEIPAGRTATFIEGDTLQIMENEVESTDIFKLFVSTESIDTFLLEMEMLELGITVEYGRTRATQLATQKAIGSHYKNHKKTKKIIANDWFTKQLIVRVIGRQNRVGDKAVKLANGLISVLPHSKLKADLAITSLMSGTRNLEAGKSIVQLLEQKGGHLMGLGGTTRSLYGVPNVLEITGIENEATLAQEPLQIEIDAQLKADETLIPLTFDGEHILPVGIATPHKDGSITLAIDKIPDTEEVKRRSLFKALKLYFMKAALKSRKLQQLRWVDYDETQARRKTEGIIIKIQEADHILLCTHGIIGDTQGQANFARSLYSKEKEAGKPFDLILTFDYENLNTPIQVTAAALKEQLGKVGIKEEGKKITILAHSMGGLVSRYFIENLNGKAVVNQLIMAGTPNAGSAIAKMVTLRDSSLMLLGFLLNFLQEIPLVGTFIRILEGTKKVTYTLGQMDYDDSEEFLRNLNLSADPEIPYYVIAGNLAQYLEQDESAKRLVNKLYKLGGKIFYGAEDNDIAASVESIFSVNSKRKPSPQKQQVACHHLNYFEHEESAEAIKKFLV